MPSNSPLGKGEKRPPPHPPPYLFIKKTPSPGSQKQILYLSQPQLCHITMLSQSLTKEKTLLFQELGIILSRSWERTTFSENMSYQFLNRSQLIISRNKELMAIEQGICSICPPFQCASMEFTVVSVCVWSV